jgi:hypothetical protein
MKCLWSFWNVLGQSEVLAGHGQSGGTVKVNMPITQSALTPGNQFVVQTPQGPKTIRIVSSPAQAVSSTAQVVSRPAQVVPSAPATVVSQTQTPSVASSDGIKVSAGMLVVDGQLTGIPVSGKTRIIYKGPLQIILWRKEIDASDVCRVLVCNL